VIELLLVIAIIGLLSSIVLVATRGVREKAEITNVIQFDASVYHSLAAYAVGVWNTDEGEFSTCVPVDPAFPQQIDICDSSGNNNHGFLIGSAWSNDTPTNKGYSLNFAGWDFVDFGDKRNFDMTDSVTVSVWVKLDQLPGDLGFNEAVFAKEGNYKVDVCTSVTGPCSLENGVRFLTSDNWGGNIISSTSALVVGKWYHIVASFGKGKKSLYINGKIESSSSATAMNPYLFGNLHLTAACYDDGSAEFNIFNDPLFGNLDDIRLYKETLNAFQVRRLYVEGAKEHELLVNN